MQFETLSDFIAMGKYGFYVWLAFGFTFFSLAVLIVSSQLAHKNAIMRIVQQQRRELKLKMAAKKQRAERAEQDIQTL